jgi:hypothetical protein
MHDRPVFPAAAPTRRIAWLGDSEGEELALARAWAGELADVVDGEDAAESAGSAPTLAVLASARPGRWTLPEAVAVTRRWPLAALVSVGTSLAEGRRRSGPSLPGVEDVAWNDLPGRLAWWLAELAAGRPGTLGMPTTARREEKLLESAARVRAGIRAAVPAFPVSIAAASKVDLDGVADLVAATGLPIAHRTRGRPPLDETADILLWDVGVLGTLELAWLRMLSANRPQLGIVILESFPRGHTARAALRAGAAAVLGRPVGIEALAGTLLRLKNTPASAIGPAGHGG